MPLSEQDIVLAVKILVDRYGETAEPRVEQHARELSDRGEYAAADGWLLVLDYLQRQRRSTAVH